VRHRIRVVKVKGNPGFFVQYSPDNLRWTTMDEFQDIASAISYAEYLHKLFDGTEQMKEITHVMWKSS
jgi:hypothetical protein